MKGEYSIFAIVMEKRHHFLFVILSCTLCLALMNSCMPTRRLNERPLLKANDVVVKGGNVDKGTLSGFIRQENNARLLGVLWFKPWLYEKLDSEEPGNMAQWMQRNLAEPPVYYDKSLAITSASQMEQWLFSKGFFNARVNHRIDDRDKATVTYKVNTGTPYKLNKITYNFQDSTLMPFVLADTASSLLQPGEKYDVDLLDDERGRITSMLRNKGFYKFSKDYIRYRVDSTVNSHKVDVFMDLLPRISKANSGNNAQKSHKRYIIDDIVINPDQTLLSSQTTESDTLVVDYKRSKNARDSVRLQFIHEKPLRVKPRTYARRVSLKNDKYYNFRLVQKTYNGLAGLNITQFVRMDFAEDESKGQGDTLGYLDCNIRINRRDIHSVSIETEGTNTAGRPGVAARLVYQNKNLFKGGEVLDLSLSGALEAQSNTSLSQDDAFLFFNTVEGGADANLQLPKFLLPVKPEFFSRDYHPVTTIHGGYNYQRRTDYKRYLAKVALGYRWRQSQTKRHTLSPIDINAIKIFTSPGFEERLAQLGKKYQEQYTDHLIASMEYSFIWNTQNVSKTKDFFYLRSNVETSGLLLDFLNQQAGLGEQGEEYSTLLNIRYAQFLRTDFDLRYYHYLQNNNSLVFRTLMGIGFPYGNSDALPFEKAFYSGGANGLRGWELRSLGPGGYSDPEGDRYERIGDILMEFSTEYRFPIYSYLNGALFADAGNIWLLNESSSYPDGHFSFDKFMSQMAVDAGFGFRVDLQFFIIRIDTAMPLRIPNREPGARWKPLADMTFGDLVWNFGIGYPF